MSPYSLKLGVIAIRLALRPLAVAFKLASDLSAVELRLAYRGLYEGRGEAVRCAAAFYIARLLAHRYAMR